jgi:A/G-specific adenine glycosylase
VLTRVFGITGNPRAKRTNARLWRIARELVESATTAQEAKESNPARPARPSRKTNACSLLNQSLMELGAIVCTPRAPRCALCPAKTLCVARRNHRVGQLPNLGRRAAVTERHFVAFLVERNGKWLVRQRPAGVVNAHLWEFPNAEAVAGRVRGAGFRRQGAALCSVRHSITRYRITLAAFRAALTHPAAKTPGSWLTLAQLEKLACAGAHRKILEHLRTATHTRIA